METPKSLFPYFGGKSRIAPVIWSGLGTDTPNYIEPFFGSGAVLFSRGCTGKVETINDFSGYVANVWRSIQHAPWEVAGYIGPVNEIDMTAQHAWLVGRGSELKESLLADPEYRDPRAAGYWIAGTCAWIGDNYCTGKGPWVLHEGRLVDRRKIPVCGTGEGISRKLPHLGDAGKGINRQLPHLGDSGKGINRMCGTNRDEHILSQLVWYGDRLRNVRVCCGDWERTVQPSVTLKHGTTAVFLDPPYDNFEGTYGECESVWKRVVAWCKESGNNPLYRICLAGYYEPDLLPGWTEYRWQGARGYAAIAGNNNRAKETLWFSPACLPLALESNSSFTVTIPETPAGLVI